MKLSMIYMASGFGRRFGSNKLLASLGGRPLYMYGLTALAEAAVLLQAEGTECQLITVSQYAEILEAARLLPLGTAAAWEDASAFLYFVADQPYTEAAVIAVFASSFLKSGKTIGCTASNGRRGSPTAFSACYRQNLMGLKGDKGGRQIMESRPDEIWIMETKADQLWDIDRAEDLDADKMKKDADRGRIQGEKEKEDA